MEAVANEVEELEFLQGEIDIPEERIAQKYTDAIVLFNTAADPDAQTTDVTKIVDTSCYLKNKVIGLTYLVPEQMLDEIKEAISHADIKERVITQLQQLYPELDLDGADSDFLENLMDGAIDEVLEEETQTQPLIPHCTVLQLTDGRWIWRQESC